MQTSSLLNSTLFQSGTGMRRLFFRRKLDTGFARDRVLQANASTKFIWALGPGEELGDSPHSRRGGITVTLRDTPTNICTPPLGYYDSDAVNTCAALNCGDHGRCFDDEGGASCLCDEGYTGSKCDKCAQHFLPQGSQCVPSGDLAAEFTLVFSGLTASTAGQSRTSTTRQNFETDARNALIDKIFGTSIPVEVVGSTFDSSTGVLRIQFKATAEGPASSDLVNKVANLKQSLGDSSSALLAVPIMANVASGMSTCSALPKLAEIAVPSPQQ